MSRAKRNLITVVFATVATAIILSSNAVGGEQPIYNHERVFENFESSLKRNDVPGIVESTIYTVVEYKNKFPELDYSKIISMLDRVSRDNNSSSIRYKAQLASMYLSDSDGIEVTPVRGAFDHEYLFKQIADQLEKKFLASHIE
jgi:hypothetical protein